MQKIMCGLELWVAVSLVEEQFFAFVEKINIKMIIKMIINYVEY